MFHDMTWTLRDFFDPAQEAENMQTEESGLAVGCNVNRYLYCSLRENLSSTLLELGAGGNG
jgi:hypothetical protein